MHRRIWARITGGLDTEDVLLGIGLTILTVGTACEYGWSIGLIVLGGLITVLGLAAVLRRAC